MTPDDDHSHDHSHGSELSDMQVRVRSLETVLSEKGYIDSAALDAIVEAYETRIGPHNGAQVVARAWNDTQFRKQLLEDATQAVNAMGNVSPRWRPAPPNRYSPSPKEPSRGNGP